MTILGISCGTPVGRYSDAAKPIDPQTAQSIAQSRYLADQDTAEKLSRPFVAQMQGRSVREAIQTVADNAGLNLWFDPGVNPSTVVDLGPAMGDDTDIPADSNGPAASSGTVADAINELAKNAGLVVFPLPNVLLVTSLQRRDAFVSAVRNRCELSPPQSIRWPTLTVPSDALRSVQSGAGSSEPTATSAAGSHEQLPHDLLPAIDWERVEPSIAAAIIRASYGDLATEPDATVPIAYPIADWVRVESQNRFPVVGGRQIVQTSVANHEKIWRAWIKSLSRGTDSSGDATTDNKRYTLKTQAPADQILRSLAAAASKTLRWEDVSTEIQNRIVELEMKDAKWDDLVTAVCDSIGVSVNFSGNEIVIGP